MRLLLIGGVIVAWFWWRKKKAEQPVPGPAPRTTPPSSTTITSPPPMESPTAKDLVVSTGGTVETDPVTGAETVIYSGPYQVGQTLYLPGASPFFKVVIEAVGTGPLRKWIGLQEVVYLPIGTQVFFPTLTENQYPHRIFVEPGLMNQYVRT